MPCVLKWGAFGFGLFADFKWGFPSLFRGTPRAVPDNFALKIGMSVNYEKCVPRNKEQLLYCPILNFCSEIWRTCKKTESAFLDLLGFDQEFEL
jgi:hypothetical protein